MSFQSNTSIAWCGICDTMIGPLKPGNSIYIPLSLIPLDSGLIVSKSIYKFLLSKKHFSVTRKLTRKFSDDRGIKIDGYFLEEGI